MDRTAQVIHLDTFLSSVFRCLPLSIFLGPDRRMIYCKDDSQREHFMEWAGSTVVVVTSYAIYQLLCRRLLCPITRQNSCPTIWILCDDHPSISAPYSFKYLLPTICHCSLSTLEMNQALPFHFTLDPSEDDAPTRTITDPTSYLDLSPTSSESMHHDSGSSQSSLSKAFQEAFFATRSRVLKVSGVCGSTSLTELT